MKLISILMIFVFNLHAMSIQSQALIDLEVVLSSIESKGFSLKDKEKLEGKIQKAINKFSPLSKEEQKTKALTEYRKNFDLSKKRIEKVLSSERRFERYFQLMKKRNANLKRSEFKTNLKREIAEESFQEGKEEFLEEISLSGSVVSYLEKLKNKVHNYAFRSDNSGRTPADVLLFILVVIGLVAGVLALFGIIILAAALTGSPLLGLVIIAIPAILIFESGW